MFGVDDPLDALDPEQRRALLAEAQHRVYPPGALLVEQESEPRSLFRIHSGFARVHRDHLGARVELGRMGPGTWFGELSLLDGAPASATVAAESRIEVDRFSEATIEKLVSESPRVAAAFHKALAVVLARRLRNLTEAIPERLLDEDDGVDVSLVDPGTVSTYLSPTTFCDFEHESIRAAAARLSEGAASAAELARAAFYFVRDEVRYSLGLTQDRASDTLLRRRGSCSHKANLFVALLRALGVPSGYHFMIVKAREYLGPGITPRFTQFMGQRSLHVFPAALVNGGWVRCDPSDDARLSDYTAHWNPPCTKIEFDGVRDAMLHLSPSSIEYYDATCWPSVDVVLARPARLPPILIAVLNRYADWARSFGLEYHEATEAANGFFGWLGKHHPTERAEFEAAEASLRARAVT
jgi:transglutaminase-like putative cysteine protease